MPLVPLLSGCLFGLGLVISGMADPAKVRAFLDLAGQWDPSLAFVLVGAVSVSAAGFYFAERRGKAFDGTALCLPNKTVIDRPLIVGAAVFGVGWGLVGLCPGPALADLLIGGWRVAVFVVAMIAGMLIHSLWLKARQQRVATPSISREKSHA